MACKRYLQRLGRSWYARVKVPARLQSQVGNTHVRKALGTRDLDEANRRKWAVVAQIKAQLADLHAAAERVRDASAAASLVGPVACPSPSIPVGNCSPIRVRMDSRRRELPLKDLLDKWLANSDYIEQTKHQHRQAVTEFLNEVGSTTEAMIVTRELAADYVERTIKGADRSYSTKRRKLDSLIAFWGWLAEQGIVAPESNPWRGYRLAKKSAAKARTRSKRPYRDDELVTLFSTRPKFPGLADLMVLGLYTGARIDELCSLELRDVRTGEGGAFLIRIRKAKTPAGVRTLAVTHQHAIDVLRRRGGGEGGEGRLFPEFRPGGYDGKLSWGASKAFGNHRDKVGLTRETDFHSLRRTFITALENLGVDQVRIARYVGHELPTLAFAVYSGGSTEATMRTTAASVRYSPQVEGAVEAFLSD